MDFSIEELRQHPRYQKATPEQKQIAEAEYTKQAYAELKSLPDFILAPEEKQAEYLETFNQHLPIGRQLQAEEKGIRQGFAENMYGQLVKGAQQTWDSLEVGARSRMGDTGIADIAAETVQRQMSSYTPAELKEIHATMQAVQKDWEAAETATQKAAVAARAVYETGKALITNPEGSAYLAAESIPNIVTPALGALGGAAAGSSVAPGPGSVVGGAVGLFSGGYVAEEGAYMIEALVSEAFDRGLDPTPENFQILIDDKEVFDKIKSKAAGKAAGTAGTDTALSLIGGSVFTKALKTAAKSKAPLRNVLKAKAGSAAFETASEPLSEAIGQKTAGDELNVGELMAETIGGVATGPIMAPVSRAISGTKAVGEAAIATVKEQQRVKPEREQELRTQAKEPTTHKFKEKVAGVAESGDLNDLAKTNPILATEAAAERNKKKDITPQKKIENQETAESVLAGLVAEKKELVTIAKELSAEQVTPKTLEEVEQAKAKQSELASVLKQAKLVDSLIKHIQPLVLQMQTPAAETDVKDIGSKISAAIKEAKGGEVKSAIVELFGSKAFTPVDTDTDVLAEAAKNDKLDAPTRKLATDLSKYQSTVKELQNSVVQATNKTMEEVHFDVLDGSASNGYVGINTYHQRIATAIQAEDTKTATEQLSKLQQFSSQRQLKAQTFQAYLDNAQKGTPIKPEYETAMVEYNKAYTAKSGKKYDIHPGSGKLIEALNLEAKIAQEATQAAESLVAATIEQPTETVETAPTEAKLAPSEPVTEPIDVTSTPVEKVPEAAKTEPTEKAEPTPVTEAQPVEKVSEPVKSDKTVSLVPYAPKTPYERKTAKILRKLPTPEAVIERGRKLGKGITRQVAREVYREKLIKRYRALTSKQIIKAGQKIAEPYEKRIAREVYKETLLKEYKELSLAQIKTKAETLPEGTEKRIAREAYKEIQAQQAATAKRARVQKTLTTHDPADPKNEVKNTFKAKKVPGLLGITKDTVEALTPDFLAQTGLFDDRAPLDEDAHSVIGSLQKFTEKFRRAFTQSFADTVNKTYSAKNLKNKARQLSPAIFTTEAKKGHFLKYIERFFADPTKNWTQEEIFQILDAKPFRDPKVIQAYKESFKTKGAEAAYRKNNPILYLVVDGKMPDKVIDALSAVAYQYVADRNSLSATMHNDDNDIRSILKLREDDAYVDPVAQRLLKTIGVPQSMLHETFGLEALRLLGIAATDETRGGLENELAMSLGLQVIAAMQTMELLTETKVLNGSNPNHTDTATTGLSGLINLHRNPNLDYSKLTKPNTFFYDPEIHTWQDIEGKGTTSFYRVKTEDKIVPRSVTEIIELNEASRHTWSRLFTGENKKRSYTWKEPEPVNPKFKRTDQNAPAEAAKKLNEHQNQPYRASGRMMNFYLMFTDPIRDRIAGKLNPLHTHIENTETMEGTNAGVDLSHGYIMAWLKDAAKQAGGYATHFFIPEEFWSMGRMGQIGEINLQGDKIHRYLFGMSDWEDAIDLGDKLAVKYFMEGVAKSLGIEEHKVGGLDKAVQMAEERLTTDPALKTGITAINDILDEYGEDALYEITPEKMIQDRKKLEPQMEAIADAVEAGGEAFYTLKGLIEYTRYRRAVIAGKPSFVTDMTTEADGISNGVIIGRIQLVTNASDVNRVLSTLQNGGLQFGDSPEELAVHLARTLSNDAYEATGVAWNKFLLDIELKLANQIKNARNEKQRQFAQRSYDSFAAMKAMFGEFQAIDGSITKIARKLSKDPTMRTMYGMGLKNLIRLIQTNFVVDFRAKLEKIVKTYEAAVKHNDTVTVNRLIAEVNELNRNMHAVTGRYLFGSKPVQAIYKEQLLGVKLTDSDIQYINNNIENFHAKAMKLAIKEIYGDIQNAMQALNNGVGLAAVMYNTLYELKLREYQAAAAREGREITNKELREIKEFCKDVLPVAETAMKGKLQLATASKEKTYKPEKQVEQYYRNDITVKKAAPYTFSGVEDPRVRATILNVHNQDSTVAVNLMGEFSFLNNHDGFTINTGEGPVLTRRANEIFYNTMKNYDMAMAMYAGVYKNVEAFQKLRTGFDTKTADQLIRKQLGYKIKPDETITDYLTRTMQAMNKVAVETQKNKKAIMDAVSQTNQYVFTNGAYKRKDPVAKTITIAGQTYKPIDVTAIEERRLQQIKESNKAKADLIGSIFNKEIISSPENDYIAEVNDSIDAPSMPAQGQPARPVLNQDVNLSNTTRNQPIEVLYSDDSVVYHDGIVYHYGDNAFATVKTRGKWSLVTLATGKVSYTSIATKGKLLDKLHAEHPDPVALKERLDKMGSTLSSVNLSTDGKDYTTWEQIDQLNVVDVYDQYKDTGTVKTNPTHDSYLKQLLSSVVQNVTKPIDLYLKENPDIETQGVYAPADMGNSAIFISSQQTIIGPVPGALSHGIRMSTGEVYAHELVHHITHFGLKLNNRLTRQVERLYNLTERYLNRDGEGFRAFLNDPTIDVDDLANVYEVRAAKERYDYVFRNTKAVEKRVFAGDIDPATGVKRKYWTSQHLNEFIALGTTNQHFLNALSQIKLEKDFYEFGIIGNNIQETISNVFQKIMDFFYNNFTRRPSGTVASELRNLTVLLANHDNHTKTSLAKIVEVSSKQYSKAISHGNDFIKGAVKKLPLAKSVQALKFVYATAKESDTALGQRLRETEYAYRRLDQGIIKSTIDEMMVRTDRVAWIFEAINRRNIWLDGAKQEESAAYTTEAKRLFTEPLNESDSPSVTKGILKTDLVTLLVRYSLDQIKSIVSSSRALERSQSDIIKELSNDPVLVPHIVYYRRAADALGYFMVHGKSRSGEMWRQNAYVIASLKDMQIKTAPLTTEQIQKAEQLIDQLATLYAVQYTAVKDRIAVKRLIEADPDAVNGVMRMHEVLKDKALKDAFHGSKYKFIKGYTKQILNPRIDVQYGTLEDEAEMAAKGYKRQPLKLQKDPDDPTDELYLYVSRSGRMNDWFSTIASLTANRAKGTAIARIATRQAETADFAPLMKHKYQLLQKMADPSFVPKLEETTSMVPLLDQDGTIRTYRYMMSEQTKDSHMEQVNDYAQILGGMAGQIIDKVRSPVINKELVQALHVKYEAEFFHNPQGFVEIGPRAEDPKMQELYFQLPPQMKKDIQKIWKSNSIWVPKDFVQLAFGFRKYSISEAFAKTPKDRAKLEKLVVGISQLLFKDKAALRARSVETVLLEATKFAKNNIIVKSLHVTLGNFGSNLIYLKSIGIPVSDIIKYGWEAYSYGIKYQADQKKLNSLRIQKEIMLKGSYTTDQLKDIDSKILRTENSLSRNPTRITIEAGLMPSFIDDVQTESTDRNFPTDFEKAIHRRASRLPKPVQTVGKVLLLTEDTMAYKTLNNAVKMTDFVGRHVMYTYNTKQGMKHEEAVAKAEDSFVNFNIPSHRMIEYFNETGFLWFTKYFTRIMKVIKDSVVDKPLDVIMAYMLSSSLGFDNILNTVPNDVGDIFNRTGTALTGAAGSVEEVLTTNAALQVVQGL